MYEALVNEFEISWLPGSLEPGLQRAVEAENGEPAFAGDRLNPVVLFASWRLRPKVESDRAVVIHDEIVFLVVPAREGLVGLKSGASLRVVYLH